MKDKIKFIKESAEKILKLLEIEAKLKVEEKEDVINLQLETNEPGILIGYHGQALQALQLLISLISFKKFNECLNIIILNIHT